MPRGPALSEEGLNALREMWLLGVDSVVIAQMLGVERASVHKARARLGLQPRGGKYTKREVDPTPEEIEERARWCLEQRATKEKAKPVEVRQYVFDGRDSSFHPCA